MDGKLVHEKSPLLGKIQTKMIWRYHFSPVRMTHIKNNEKIHVCCDQGYDIKESLIQC